LSEKKALPDPKDVSIRILESELAKVNAERHAALIKEILELKLEAGLKSGEVELETQRLSEMPDEALRIMKDDWKKVINKLAARKRLYR